MASLDILLTVHLSIILVTDQLNAPIIFIISLLYSCTCFEYSCAHHQEVKIVLYSTCHRHTVGGRPVRTAHWTATYGE